MRIMEDVLKLLERIQLLKNCIGGFLSMYQFRDGVTKGPFANFSVTGNFDLAKV